MNKGLFSEEVKLNQNTYGKNIVKYKKKNIFLLMFFQLISPFTLILALALCCVYKYGNPIDFYVLMGLTICSVILGVILKSKVEKGKAQINEKLSFNTSVLRDGLELTIKNEELTVGDYVILRAGTIVPADVELTLVDKFIVDDFALTKSHAPVEKEISEDTSNNICNAYSVVLSGYAEGIVKAIGEKTAVFKNNIKNKTKKEKTNREKNLQRILVFMFCISFFYPLGLFFANVFILHKPIELALQISIPIVLFLLPKGIIALYLNSLTYTINKIKSNNIFVKDVSNFEKINSIDLVCLNKTNMLTDNNFQVKESYFNGVYLETDYVSLKNMMVNGFILCNEEFLPNAINEHCLYGETLLEYANKNKYDIEAIRLRHPLISEIPYTNKRKIMTTLHSFNDTTISFTKGDIGNIIKCSDRILLNGKPVPFTISMKTKVMQRAKQMADKSLQIISIGFRMGDSIPNEENLIFLGFVGVADNLKENVKENLTLVKESGIYIALFTDDQKVNSFAFANQLGICETIDSCISGKEIENMNKEELEENVLKFNVFARVSDVQKKNIIEAFKNKGKNVATIENKDCDISLFHIANVAIGTQELPQCNQNEADIICEKNELSLFVNIVEQSKSLLKNTKKTFSFLLTLFFGALLICNLTSLGFESIFSLTSVLWISALNVFVPAHILSEDTNTNLLNQLPEQKNKLFGKKDIAIIALNSCSFAVSNIIAFLIPLILSNVSINNFIANPTPELLANCQSFLFATFVLSSLIMVLVSKTYRNTVFDKDVFNNKFLNLFMLLQLLILIAIMTLPVLSEFFGFSVLQFEDWIFVITCSLFPLFISEIKYLLKKQ